MSKTKRIESVESIIMMLLCLLITEISWADSFGSGVKDIVLIIQTTVLSINRKSALCLPQKRLSEKVLFKKLYLSKNALSTSSKPKPCIFSQLTKKPAIL